MITKKNHSFDMYFLQGLMGMQWLPDNGGRADHSGVAAAADLRRRNDHLRRTIKRLLY
jgi:hypothetical protein